MTKEISNYTSLVTRFHKKRPRFIASVTKSLQPIVDGYNFIEGLPEKFDLDKAIGVQLDAVGKWINLSRNVYIPVPDPWFRFGDNKRGWSQGYWVEPLYFKENLAVLDDETYRRLLKARIKANQWDGTAKSGVEILKSFFDGSGYTIVVDDKNTMHCYYGLAGTWPDRVMLELFRGVYLPLAASGVKTYHYITSVNTAPLFGFGVTSNSISGWGTGAWGVDPTTVLTAP